LGTPCVERLSKNGWTVFAVGTNRDKLKKLGELPGVIPIGADITDTDSMYAARRAVMEHTDRLDAVVNLAGVSFFHSLVENDPLPCVERALAVNVLGTARTNAVFFELIERGHGRIINCSSSAGWMTAQPFAGAYIMSKRAVEGYNDSLRRELAILGIPVIKLQPGSFRTSITGDVEHGYDETLKQTKRYRAVLTKLKPLMDKTLRKSEHPDVFADTVIKALETKHPKIQYRKNSSFLLRLLDLLPETWIDRIYRIASR